jgi:hypothetical protein
MLAMLKGNPCEQTLNVLTDPMPDIIDVHLFMTVTSQFTFYQISRMPSYHCSDNVSMFLNY